MTLGTKMGSWTVMGRPALHFRPCGAKSHRIFCECECGTGRYVDVASLVHGRSKSCGHFKRLWGKLNPGWKGGRTLHKSGYVVIVGRKIAGKVVGRTLEHISVMEEKLGRKLKRGETVHHKNGIRRDNRRRNLELWASNHPSGQRVSDLVTWAKRLLKKYKPETLR